MKMSKMELEKKYKELEQENIKLTRENERLLNQVRILTNEAFGKPHGGDGGNEEKCEYCYYEEDSIGTYNFIIPGEGANECMRLCEDCKNELVEQGAEVGEKEELKEKENEKENN